MANNKYRGGLTPAQIAALEETFPDRSREKIEVSPAVEAQIIAGLNELKSMMPEDWGKENVDFQETEGTRIVGKLLGELVLILRDNPDIVNECKDAIKDKKGFPTELLNRLIDIINSRLPEEVQVQRVQGQEVQSPKSATEVPRWLGGGKILSALCIVAGIFIIASCPLAIVAGFAVSLATQSAEPVTAANAWCKMIGIIARPIGSRVAPYQAPASTVFGGDAEYINILGRRRKVVREGRYKMINYKGQKMCLTDARKLEKQMK